jgi:hypothetical protein
MQRSDGRRPSLPAARVCAGLILIALGAAALVPPSGLGGVGEDPMAVDKLREGVGRPVEVNPDGTYKTSLAWVEIGTQRYEKRTHFDRGSKRRAVYKTPAREFAEDWDAAKGWVPAEVTRDETTLAARWGLPTVGWPYYAAGLGMALAGAGLLLSALIRPRRGGGSAEASRGD